jgi:hypothetical protein
MPGQLHRLDVDGRRGRHRERTLGEELEAVRLAHRVHRLESVLTTLHWHARGYPEGVPPALASAICDFDGELAVVRARLAVIAGLSSRSPQAA